MRKLGFLAPIILLLSVSSAVAQDVNYNYDQSTDFTKYKTYKWVSIKNAEQVDELISKQLTSAIDSQLALKGLAKTDSDSADLYIAFQTAIRTEQQLNAYSTGWGYGPGWRYGGGSRTISATTTTIPVGILVLDLYDAKTHSLVWRGMASKTIDPKAKPDKRAKNINRAVEKLLKNYPPKVKK